VTKLVEDLEVFLEENYTIIGSISRNGYIKINTNNLYAINFILNQFDGSRTLDRINKNCENINIRINIFDLYERMKNKNLLYENNIHKKSKIYNSGKMLIKKEFEYKANNTKMKYKLSRISFKLLCIINIIMFIILILKFDKFLYFLKGNFLVYNGSYIQGIGVGVIISSINLIIHEIGHILIAFNYNVSIHEIGLFLYLGIIQKWFVKFRGIRAVNKKIRCKIYLGGIYLNLTCILIAICLSFFNFNIEFLRIVVVTNTLMIFNCLIPFSLTDGYFFISDTFKVNNFRINLKNLLNFKYIKTYKEILLCYCIGIFMYVFKLYLKYTWIYCALSEITKISCILTILMIGIHLIILYKKLIKRKKLENYD